GDEAVAWMLIEQTLMASGKLAEARESISQAIQFAEHSHDLEISLMSGVISARIDAASGSPAQRREVAKRLNAVAQQAKAAEFVYAALEARLAMGEVELNSGNTTAGRTHPAVLAE